MQIKPVTVAGLVAALACTLAGSPPEPTGDVAPDQYDLCNGTTVYRSCYLGSCIARGTERRVYRVWRDVVNYVQGLDPEQESNRLAVSDVTLHFQPETGHLIWSIDYVLTIDWVRIAKTMRVDLSAVPLLREFTDVSELTDSDIERAIWRSINLDGFRSPATVAPLAHVLRAFDECFPGTWIVSCDFRRKGPGRLVASGVETESVGSSGRYSMLADVDLVTAKTLACYLGSRAAN